MTIVLAKRAIFVCSVALVVWMLAASPLSGQRGWHQGDTWLKWNRDSRENFLFGYISGYSTAYGDVCRQVAAEPPEGGKSGYENLPINKCLKGQLDFSKGSDYFVKNITDFYTRYPEDRDIYIYEVVEQLANGLTLEKIHNHPFWRHKPPQPKP